MDRKHLVKRRRVLRDQIRIFKKKIIDSKSEYTEQILLKKLEDIRTSLAEIEKRLEL